MINKLASAFTKLLGEFRELRAKVEDLPAPKDGAPGKPGVSPALEAVAELVLAQLPTLKDGEPGKDADVQAVIKEVLAQIPAPKDGKPGRDAQPPLLADVAALVLAKIPTPKDGVSPTAKQGKPGKDGVSPSPKAVAALVKVPVPKQGKTGKAGASITDVKLERNILSVWIDGVKKRVGKIDPPRTPAFAVGGGGNGRERSILDIIQTINRGTVAATNEISKDSTDFNFAGPALQGVFEVEEEGLYRLGVVYQWRHEKEKEQHRVKIEINGVENEDLRAYQHMGGKNNQTSVRMQTHTFTEITLVPGEYTVDMLYSTNKAGDTAYLYYRRLYVERVG